MLETEIFEYLYKILKTNSNLPIIAACVIDNQIYFEFNDEKEHAEEKLLKKYSIDKIYITLEPCPSCLFKCLFYNVKTIYFGAYNTQYGPCGGKIFLLNQLNILKKIEIFGGFLEKEFSELLKNYFKNKRCIKYNNLYETF